MTMKNNKSYRTHFANHALRIKTNYALAAN